MTKPNRFHTYVSRDKAHSRTTGSLASPSVMTGERGSVRISQYTDHNITTQTGYVSVQVDAQFGEITVHLNAQPALGKGYSVDRTIRFTANGIMFDNDHLPKASPVERSPITPT